MQVFLSGVQGWQPLTGFGVSPTHFPPLAAAGGTRRKKLAPRVKLETWHVGKGILNCASTKALPMASTIGSTIQRRRFIIHGIVQGVGFRPFVYGQAQRHRLAGFVLNDSNGVTIEVEGTIESLNGFE